MGRNKSSTAVNKRAIDSIMVQAMNKDMPDGVYFGKITGKLGEGRMRIYYEESGKGHEGIGRIRGALLGKGRCPIQTNDVVLVSAREFERGDSAKKHFDICGVFDAKQAYQLKKQNIIPDYFLNAMDAGIIVKKDNNDAIEFDYGGDDDEVDVDNI
jgi:translation initiation factor IF-1